MFIQPCTPAILYYDFILTLPLEVERYWTGSYSWASTFFFVNRYMSVLSHGPVIYEFFALIPEEVRSMFVSPLKLTQARAVVSNGVTSPPSL